MGWEEEMFRVLDDLEQRAAVAFDAERAEEVADRTLREYQQVTWLSRAHGSGDVPVTLRVQGIGVVAGHLTRTGEGWVLLQASRGSWLVPVGCVLSVAGLGERSVPGVARGVWHTLSLASPLRALAETQEPVLVHLVDGSSVRGEVGRVGADFVEVHEEHGVTTVLPWQGIAAVQSRES